MSIIDYFHYYTNGIWYNVHMKDNDKKIDPEVQRHLDVLFKEFAPMIGHYSRKAMNSNNAGLDIDPDKFRSTVEHALHTAIATYKHGVTKDEKSGETVPFAAHVAMHARHGLQNLMANEDTVTPSAKNKIKNINIKTREKAAEAAKAPAAQDEPSLDIGLPEKS